MDLYYEILECCLRDWKKNNVFPDLRRTVDQIVELRCYKALKEIKAVMDDDSLETEEYFTRIDQILSFLGDSDDGTRHDIG
ncbi:MAG: hypothetical protein E7463_15800 [Ruminococcaceae bacterium]|nr:hypothetical protein [Oscillospiraceae bacterium]